MVEIGRLQNIWFGKEVTAGTQVTPTVWLPKVSGDLKPIVEKAIEDSSYWVIDERSNSYVTKKSSEITLWGNARDLTIWHLLLWAFWAVSSSVKSWETVVYEHNFSRENSNNHQSYSIWLQDESITEAISFAMLDTLDINAEAWGFVTFDASLKGRTVTSGASQTPSYVTENEFIAPYTKIYFADDLAWLDWASETKLLRVKLWFVKNLIDIAKNGTTEVDFHNQQFWVSWDFDAVFEDATFRDYVLNGTKKAMRIEIINTNANIWVGSNPTIQIDMAQVSFDEWSRSSDNNWIINETIWFIPEYNLWEAKTVTAKLINTQATY